MTGSLHRHRLESGFVADRNVDVWCPSGDVPAGGRPVVYMHDGQNVFDPRLAYGGTDWGVVEAAERLAGDGLVAPVIVGIWNAGMDRYAEYRPEMPVDPASAAPVLTEDDVVAPSPTSRAYLRAIVEEVRPLVDATYPVSPARERTFVMGSSMGGLISLFALAIYPDVFGGAACLSTHWPIGGDPLVDAIAASVPPAGRHRLYLDHGTLGLDAGYGPFQERFDRRLAERGFVRGRDWVSLRFEGADHNEASWRERVEIPLRYLLTGALPTAPA